MEKRKLPHNRIPWLDAVRGLTVISMIFYHFMWDLVYIFGKDYPWFESAPGYIWQQSICWSFVIISGFSFSLGNHPIKRGLIISLIGVAITVVTTLFMPEMSIWFGVLTLLGACMIICDILKVVLIHIPWPLGLVISAVAFFFTRNINEGFFGFEKLNIVHIPAELYANKVTAFFGFPPADFYSTDYFSLFPWIFLFLFGFYLYMFYDSVLFHSDGPRKHVPGLWYIGRDALFIYVIHQPVIYGILFVLDKLGKL